MHVGMYSDAPRPHTTYTLSLRFPGGPARFPSAFPRTGGLQSIKSSLLCFSSCTPPFLSPFRQQYIGLSLPIEYKLAFPSFPSVRSPQSSV